MTALRNLRYPFPLHLPPLCSPFPRSLPLPGELGVLGEPPLCLLGDPALGHWVSTEHSGILSGEATT